jgi:hypothetical protein
MSLSGMSEKKKNIPISTATDAYIQRSGKSVSPSLWRANDNGIKAVRSFSVDNYFHVNRCTSPYIPRTFHDFQTNAVNDVETNMSASLSTMDEHHQNQQHSHTLPSTTSQADYFPQFSTPQSELGRFMEKFACWYAQCLIVSVRNLNVECIKYLLSILPNSPLKWGKETTPLSILSGKLSLWTTQERCLDVRNSRFTELLKV